MGESQTSIAPESLNRLIGSARCPVILDVRRRAAFDAAERVIATAAWRDHRAASAWATGLPRDRDIVVYCVHGHAVSQSAAALLRAGGLRVRYLEGGIDGFVATGGVTARNGVLPERADGGPSHWITRARPKIDRIACPWLIRRFIDREAVFHFVAPEFVRDIAEETGAIAFDIPDTAFSHVGELCSFDAFVERFGLTDPALNELAVIVRGADTARLDLAAQSAGLLAMSLGLSALHEDDLAMLEGGMMLYDALYAWLRHAADETHNWPQPSAAA